MTAEEKRLTTLAAEYGGQVRLLREALRLFLNRSNRDEWPERTWEDVIANGRAVMKATEPKP